MKSVCVLLVSSLLCCLSLVECRTLITPSITTLSSPKTTRSSNALFGITNRNKQQLKLLTTTLRGGATRSKTKRKKKSARTGSLSSLDKTSTGKTKAGAAKKKAKEEEEKSKGGELISKYKSILPLTRIYITMVALSTFFGFILGEELAQGIFALDPIRFLYGLEVWRPITAGTFLGAKPSINWLMSGYYLFNYGSTLERAYGTAQHLIFLFTQITLLTLFSIVFQQPFFTNSLITSMLHVLSRTMPHQKTKWIIFTVPYWSLPYGLMLSDVLQSGSPMAALPHVLGILAGHYYFFYKFIWPKLNPDKNQDWLVAPDFLIKRLDPQAKQDTTSKDTISSALKSRKRGKGRKLGSS